MTWFVERRLDAIDWCLSYLGEVNRKHLIAAFGISKPQAASDFAAYLRLYPGSMVYDKNRKCYVAPNHKRRRDYTSDGDGRLMFVMYLEERSDGLAQ